MPKIRRALLSVYDKRDLVPLARALCLHGIEILSTGGTAEALRGAGVPFVAVSDFTGFPEILDGRVKTLHPRVHAGLLARSTPEHEAEMAAHGLAPIDLVVVNLYPFAATIARPEATFADAIENIDIGGPTMIRAAAKNHERVAVVVRPEEYLELIRELDEQGGALTAATRFRLAARAFAYTAAYDGVVSTYLSGASEEATGQRSGASQFPSVLTLQWQRSQRLRYGENPHQAAAFYVDGERPTGACLGFAEVLQGKELSYNNLLDLDSALALSLEFDEPVAVVVKHTNPCGVATDASAAEAYRLARAADPVSAFGGIVAVNRVVDGELAGALGETFLEAVIAPDFTPDALSMLGKKKNLRLVRSAGASEGDPPAPIGSPRRSLSLRTVSGGLLVQAVDSPDPRSMAEELNAARSVTRRAPSDPERAALGFAWNVVKHVKSNGIVLATQNQTIGIGAGQMSRVDSVRLAVQKAAGRASGPVLVLASDAFFPFRDGVDAAAAAGVTAVVQPGGSVRDEEVIAAADEAGMAMLLTGRRHFRH